jgi:hypothetical protein
MPDKDETSHLVLGWEVTKNLEPRYWVQNKDPKPGAQADDDLVRIPAELMASHTAIIAQSGSGKSFFLGRLIEEILINTRARCVILDPNGDFRRAYEVESDELWRKASYDSSTRKGKLPTEDSKDTFSRLWDALTICINQSEVSRREWHPSKAATCSVKPLRVCWIDIEVDFFAQDVDPLLNLGLVHCHQFVRNLKALYSSIATHWEINLLSESKELLSLPKESLPKKVEDRFPFELNDIIMSRYRDITDNRKLVAELHRGDLNHLRERLIAAATFVSHEDYYFAKANEYWETGILDTWGGRRVSESFRLNVIDLPSLSKKKTRNLAVYARLNSLWREARDEWSNTMKNKPEEDYRVPTFIVLDEAHNMIPADPPGKPETVLRDLFRTIIAEGRKYGLFLILVTQRPDKVDPMILSGCDNVAVMRLNSESIANKTAKILGMDALSEKMLQECLRFDPGRVFLTGQWTPDGPRKMYTAARRTVEGGRNLRPEYWAHPEPIPKPEAAETEPAKVIEAQNKSVSEEAPKKAETTGVGKAKAPRTKKAKVVSKKPVTKK